MATHVPLSSASPGSSTYAATRCIPSTSIVTGYRKGLTAIIDANIVTFLVAFILFIIATAGIRGFAFTLGLTTVIDLLVVFLFTKPVVTLLARTRFFSGGSKWSGLSIERLGGRAPTPTAQRPGRRTAKEA